MSDSFRLAIDELRAELLQAFHRLEDLERQVALALERIKLLPIPSMPQRQYPARLESHGPTNDSTC